MPIRRWSRHPNESWDILKQQLDSTEVANSRHQRTGSETGYVRLNVHPILRSASVCVYILLLFNYSIISLLLIDCTHFTFILPNLHISLVSAFLTLENKIKNK